MFEKISIEKQLRKERARRLENQNKQKKSEEIILEQLVDIDYQQSMAKMGVQ